MDLMIIISEVIFFIVGFAIGLKIRPKTDKEAEHRRELEIIQATKEKQSYLSSQKFEQDRKLMNHELRVLYDKRDLDL